MSESSIKLFDLHGSPQLISNLLAKGAEGSVYPLKDKNHILVKYYNEKVLTESGSYLKEKIEEIKILRNQFEPHNISWPAINVYDENKRWIGYAMKKVEGKTLRSLAHAMLYEKYAPNLTRINIVDMLINFLEKIKILHKFNVMIGDYNLSNFMWNPVDFTIGFIDCDSYQIDINKKHFPCLVGSPDLTAPEHHNKPYKDIIRTPQSEYFSITIILFMCLMLGRHPYDIINGDDPVNNMRSGRFAYGRGNTGIPKGNWYNIWSHMPYRIKDLFIKNFTEGTQDPNQRPSIEEWLKALTIYKKEILKGYHRKEIIPDKPKSSV